MATFYIDPSLTSTGDGSFETPFSSWTSVTWTAGNTYLQKEGTTYVGTIAPTTNGTSTARILIGVYDLAGNSVTDGSKTATIRSNVDEDCINLARSGSRSYFDIIGLNLYQGGRSGATLYHAIHARAAFENTTRSITIKYVKMSGLGGPTLNARGIGYTITHCEIFDFYDDGMKLETANTEVAYCKIYRPQSISSGGTSNSDCLEIKSQTGTDLGFAWIHHNYFENLQVNNLKQCIILQDLTRASGVGNFIVEDNILVGGGGASIFTNFDNTIIRRNLIINPEKVALAAGGVGHLFYSNVVECRFLVVLNNNDTSLSIIGNTIKKANSRLVSITDGVTGCSIVYKNNVALSVGAEDTAARTHYLGASNTLTANTNAYPTSPPPFTIGGVLYDTYAEYQTATSQDLASITDNPVLDYYSRPRSTSPLLGIGTFISQLGDMDGRLRNNPPSIGAYEYVAERGDAGTRGSR